jgi:hypothetical protein|tara:strand:- start:238 stop:366 length:129 start_codon:yes stop_codon:yes gene_type:complete
MSPVFGAFLATLDPYFVTFKEVVKFSVIIVERKMVRALILYT